LDPEASLGEVAVGRQGFVEFEFPHDHEAGAIGE
jgi:hypothetical protein